MLAAAVSSVLCGFAFSADEIVENFVNPPDSARLGVYSYFMDGNLNGKEMIADLESMKAAGLGNLVFLEVDVGIPKGPVRWMTEPWQDLFVKNRPRHGAPGHRHHPRHRTGLDRHRRTMGQGKRVDAAPAPCQRERQSPGRIDAERSANGKAV